MRSHLHSLAALAWLLESTLAFPGMAKTLMEIKKRAASPIASPEDSSELFGDLETVGVTTNVGQTISDILLGKADSQNDEPYTAPAALGTPECAVDACCTWKYVADEMAAKFKGESNRCNLYARGAVRLGFHDAGAWKKGLSYGGADGSIILTDEISRPVNKGLEEIVDQMREWYSKYKQYGVGAADLVQMGATVATVVCPLGPRIRSFVGRVDNAQLPPDGLLPDVEASADELIKLFEDKTIKPNGLVALVGAHTTSQQRFFQPQKAFDPQDTTPGVWDVLFYNQTVNTQSPQRVVKFTSDVRFSEHPRMAAEWQAFTDPQTGQAHWNDDFAKEYVRLSMLGVENMNNLTECTKVLPAFTGFVFNAPDKDQISQWIQGGFSNYGQKIGELLDKGEKVTGDKLGSVGINPGDWANHQAPAAGSPWNQKPPSPAEVHNPPPKLERPSMVPVWGNPFPSMGNTPESPRAPESSAGGNKPSWPKWPSKSGSPTKPAETPVTSKIEPSAPLPSSSSVAETSQGLQPTSSLVKTTRERRTSRSSSVESRAPSSLSEATLSSSKASTWSPVRSSTSLSATRLPEWMEPSKSSIPSPSSSEQATSVETGTAPSSAPGSFLRPSSSKVQKPTSLETTQDSQSKETFLPSSSERTSKARSSTIRSVAEPSREVPKPATTSSKEPVFSKSSPPSSKAQFEPKTSTWLAPDRATSIKEFEQPKQTRKTEPATSVRPVREAEPKASLTVEKSTKAEVVKEAVKETPQAVAKDVPEEKKSSESVKASGRKGSESEE